MDTAERSTPAELVDEVMPESFDWERLVTRYPIPALAVAAIGGFVLGRTRGTTILNALSDFAADQVTGQVNRALGEDIL